MVKSMGKRIINMWKLSISELKLFLVVALCGGAFGVGLTALIVNLDDTPKYANLGVLMAILIGTVVHMFVGCFYYGSDFSLAVSYGVTRKEFFVANAIVSYINIAINIAVIAVIYCIERVVGSLLYKGKEFEDIIFVVRDYPFTIVLILMIPAIRAFFGSFILKFQKKAMWIIWALWMFFCLGLPRLVSYISEHPDSLVGDLFGTIIEGVFKTDNVVLTVILLVVTVIMFVASRFMQKKQSVVL